MFRLVSTASARTWPFTPLDGEPRADQAVPFHSAMWLTDSVPALVKTPPAYRLPLVSTASAETDPPRPESRPTQLALAKTAARRSAAGPSSSVSARSEMVFRVMVFIVIPGLV